MTVLAGLSYHYKTGARDDDSRAFLRERQGLSLSLDSSLLLDIANGRKIETSSFPAQYQFHKASNFTELLLNPDTIPGHYIKDINAQIKLQNDITKINSLPFHLLCLVCAMSGN